MPDHRLRPAAPPELDATLATVQAQIEALSRDERAILRPWLLARFDARGYRVGIAATQVAPLPVRE